MNAIPDSFDFEIGSYKERAADEIFGIPINGKVRVLDNDRYVPGTNRNYRFSKDSLQAILAFLFARSVGDGLMLHGPFGVGKTSLIREILGRLNWPTLMLSWNETSDTIDLIGRNGIQFGDTVFEYGPLAIAAKKGFALVVNEIDRGRAGNLVALNDLLDGGQLLLKETGEVIKPHPMFRLICTANSAGNGDLTGNYVGSVRKLDPAFLDRFAMLAVDYMPTDVELDLILLEFADYAKKSSSFLKNMVDFANETRAKATDIADTLSTPMSTRSLIRTLRMGRMMGLLSRVGEADFTSDDVLPALNISYLNRLAPDEREAMTTAFRMKVA